LGWKSQNFWLGSGGRDRAKELKEKKKIASNNPSKKKKGMGGEKGIGRTPGKKFGGVLGQLWGIRLKKKGAKKKGKGCCE